MIDKPPEYNLMYFQSNRVAFFFSHPEGSMLNALVSEFLDKSNALLQSFDGYESAKFSLDEKKIRKYSFESVPSLTECYISKLDISRSPRITASGSSSIVFAPIEGGPDDQIKLFRMIIGLEAELRKEQLVKGLTLEAILPNWLASGAPEGSGTGGPGGWPVAYRGAPEKAPYQIRNLRRSTEPPPSNPNWISIIISWIKKLLALLFGKTNPTTFALKDIVTNTSKGKDVHVVILDTVLSQEKLDKAYSEWKDRHPLIHSLLRPGNLELHPITDKDVLDRIKDLRALGHDYEMTDHGLFAAGLVHTIAPCAKIHLVQVLNDYGVGDMDTIIKGFLDALVLMDETENEKQSFVINGSIILNLPLAIEHLLTGNSGNGDCFADLYTDLDRLLEKEISIQLQKDPDWIRRQRIALENVCNKIYAKKSRVIAAAGNDRSFDESVPPPARYPAALESVQGVGALPRNPVWAQDGKRKTSAYSNLADTPGYIGIATLGGEEGEGQGVLGLYLGEFPGGEPNNTKWAWWPGTSFATPIFSGITAVALGDLSQTAANIPSRQPTQAAIDALYTSMQYIVNSEGEGDVDVLDITQG